MLNNENNNDDEEKKINLLDLIDINFLQAFQDNFAKAMGIATLTVDDKGPITKPSNATDFCLNYIRSNEFNFQKCNNCHIKGGELAAAEGKPITYTCHVGLMHFVVPIMVKGQHVASIFGGQIFTKKLDKDAFSKIVNDLGVNNEEETLEDLEKIKVVPDKRIKSAAQLLFFIANAISEIAHKNYELIEKCKREELTKNALEKIRGTLDPEEMKKYFIEIISNYFDTDRCLFLDYNNETDKFLPFRLEKMKSPEIKSLVGIETEIEFPEFCEKIRRGKNIIIKDLEKTLTRKNLMSYKSIKTLKENDTKSDYGLIVACKERILGVLIIHFVKKKRVLTHDEFNFLKTLKEQTGVAIYQAELYSTTKRQMKREQTLRRMLEAVRSSLNIDEMKNLIVNIIGKNFGADRCFFIDYDGEKDKFLTVKCEYLSSDTIPTYTNADVNEDVPCFAEELKKGNSILINNKQIFINGEQRDCKTEKETAQRVGVISAYGIPFFYDNQLQGAIALHYLDDKHSVSQSEAKFLEIIANQTAIALYQAKLYETTKIQGEREALLRKIFEAMRDSLDINVIKNTIVNEIGKNFNVDICFIMIYDPVANYFYIDKHSEYRSSLKEKSFIEVNSEEPKFKFFLDLFKKNQELYFSNSEEFIIENNLQGSLEEEFLKDYDIKSVYSLPTSYVNNLLGYIHLIFTNNYKKLDKSDFKFLRVIATQAGVTLHQAKLYEITRIQAKREILIRIIIEKIRISLDIEETLEFICEETAKLFKVQRAAITKYPNPQNYQEFKLRKEYKSYPNLKGFFEITEINEIAPYWANILINEDEVLALDNIMESDTPDYFKNSYNALGIKALMGTPIRKSTDVWGTLVLSEYNNYRHWSEEEKTLLKIISDQIYIAINQAELYEKEKLALEREKISKNIIEILRSSLDKDIIKRLFVKNIGKFFEADRVFFSEYDSNIKMFLPIDKNSEYLSSDKEKSFVDYDWSNPDIKEHIQFLLEKREIKIPDWHEYIKQHPEKPESFRTIYENADVESSYNFPVLYQDKLMGYFCIEFTNRIYKLLDDDINRIRNICTQAGIALYHAEMYMKAQQSMFSKAEFIAKYAQNIEEPVNDIIETTELLSKNEFERIIQIQYLNHIINSCNELLELTKDVYDSNI